MFEYMSSWLGITILVLSSAVFGLRSYDVFAKVWPVTTGRYCTDGWITWSEFVSPSLVLLREATSRVPNEGLISYAYRVNNEQHNGTIPITPKLTQEEVDKSLYKGAKVKVYYSPRIPTYSYARKPPSQAIIAGSIVAKWFVVPVAVINGLAFFVWFLATA